MGLHARRIVFVFWVCICVRVSVRECVDSHRYTTKRHKFVPNNASHIEENVEDNVI